MVDLEGGHEVAARAVVLATGAEYRRLPLDGLTDYEGVSVFYAAGPPEARLCGGSRVAVVGGGNSAGQAAVWLAKGGALVTLLHRRADLSETMSDYLIRELEKHGASVRDRSEIAELHGAEGHLEGVTLTDGTHLPFSVLFLFLGARPCTEWLGAAVARDDDGFILTGEAAGAANLLETSVPGIFAAGDVRIGLDEALRHGCGGRVDGRAVRAQAPLCAAGGGGMSATACTHLDQVAVHELPAEVEGCEDCLRSGGKWLHLRICLTCGHIGCCDSSPGRHATAHHRESSHPIVRSLEPGEEWSWCYPDELALLIEGVSGETRIPPSPLLQ